MPVSRSGTRSRSSTIPASPRAAISNEEEVRPAAPMSWIATMQSLLHQLEAGLDQQLLGERVADLHRRPLGLGLVAELGRGHGGAVDAVAAGLGADIDHRIPDAAGLGVEDPVGARDADAHRVDQDVAVVGAVEGALAADGRHADAVAVAADAGNHAADQVPGLRMRRIAEAQRVEQRHRPRTHGEHVAQDAADAGRRPLVGLDERRVVVALHLEDRDQTVADVDHARVLARAAHHPGRLGRKLAEMDLRGFVGAVLAPHHREDAELDQVRRPAQDAPGSAGTPRASSPCSATISGVIGVAHASASSSDGTSAGRRCRRAAARSRARDAASGPARCARARARPRCRRSSRSGCRGSGRRSGPRPRAGAARRASIT